MLNSMFFSNDTLSVTNFTNNGTLYINGLLSILDYSSNNSSGIINCASAASILLYDTSGKPRLC
jgi:hypothetical protein